MRPEVAAVREVRQRHAAAATLTEAAAVYEAAIRSRSKALLANHDTAKVLDLLVTVQARRMATLAALEPEHTLATTEAVRAAGGLVEAARAYVDAAQIYAHAEVHRAEVAADRHEAASAVREADVTLAAALTRAARTTRELADIEVTYQAAKAAWIEAGGTE